jgi:hypothetical protein
MTSTPPSKNTDWQTTLKRKTWKSVVYKKPTLQTETNIALRGKKIYQANGPPSRQEEQLLKLDKVEFKAKLVRRDKKGHFILYTLY